MVNPSPRRRYQILRLEDLLHDQPNLRVLPLVDSNLRLAGTFTFSAAAPGSERINDSYEIQITIPKRFPAELPAVQETAGRIRKTFHTNPDGTLCLGSPTRLHLLSRTPQHFRLSPTLLGALPLRIFAPREVRYAPIWGTTHGFRGICQDYADIFRVRSESAAMEMVRLASLKKRIANKHPCPCGGDRARQVS